MHTRTLLIALAVATLLAPSAGAELKQYVLQMNLITASPNDSPTVNLSNRNNLRTRFVRDNRPRSAVQDCGPEGCSRATIEDDGGGSPVLKKLVLWDDRSQTQDVPGLGGFIYINDAVPEGPSGEFTGAGSTDATIAWGIVTGWTATGTYWCNSSPGYICGVADRANLESSDPVLKSSFYDLGTWTFHGTGWTARPFLYQTFPNPGNTQYVLRGRVMTTGEVPALPLFALGLLGGGVVAFSARVVRRKRQ